MQAAYPSSIIGTTYSLLNLPGVVPQAQKLEKALKSARSCPHNKKNTFNQNKSICPIFIIHLDNFVFLSPRRVLATHYTITVSSLNWLFSSSCQPSWQKFQNVFSYIIHLWKKIVFCLYRKLLFCNIQLISGHFIYC